MSKDASAALIKVKDACCVIKPRWRVQEALRLNKMCLLPRVATLCRATVSPCFPKRCQTASRYREAPEAFSLQDQQTC